MEKILKPFSLTSGRFSWMKSFSVGTYHSFDSILHQDSPISLCTSLIFNIKFTSALSFLKNVHFYFFCHPCFLIIDLQKVITNNYSKESTSGYLKISVKKEIIPNSSIQPQAGASTGAKCSHIPS